MEELVQAIINLIEAKKSLHGGSISKYQEQIIIGSAISDLPRDQRNEIIKALAGRK